MTSLASLASASSRPSQLESGLSRRAQPDQQALLAERLAKRLGLEPGALAGKANDYSPAKVAERVLGFIDTRLRSEAAAGADTARLQQLLGQAREGIEQGFADARKLLDGMGLLQGQVAADIDATYQRIQQGLGSLEAPLAAPAEVAPSLMLAASAERFSAQAQTFELSVTTRDGDRLRISAAQASASWSQSQLLAGSAGSSSAVALSSQSASLQIGAWQVSVEGELDAEERVSLEKLFVQIQDLSNQFYAGDLNGAFERAMALDMDGEQLASLSLQLTQTRVRQATTTYGEVAQQGGQAASAVNGDLLDYARGLLEALRSVSELAEQPQQTLSDLLKAGFALDERYDLPRLERAEQFNQRLLDGLQGLLGEPAAADPS